MSEIVRVKPPSKHNKIYIAMSGGVDSSVAAAILVEQGYEVSGVMLGLWSDDSDNFYRSKDQAEKVSKKIGIDFQVLDSTMPFRDEVVQYFIQALQNGFTPNPCFVCNMWIKWGVLLEDILRKGGEHLASGHYARVIEGSNGRIELHKGVDPGKDQSYVLAGLDQFQLSHAVFPLGEMTKSQTREIARRYSFYFNEIKESQDLCFLGGQSQSAFLEKYAPSLFRQGEIRDQDGKLIGTHNGLANYTIGQRKGLGAGNQQPLFVIRKEVATNTLIIGTRQNLGSMGIKVTEVRWISGVEPVLPLQVEVKIRYKSSLIHAKIDRSESEGYDIIFEDEVRDPTPGQYAVFYQGDNVIGSAVISASFPGEKR